MGEMGLTLSGGQRQRINIARALYRRPRLLILDEATSALDSVSERDIHQNLRSLTARPTVFIIAHKISTLMHADRILVLEEGTIASQGTHAELLRQSPAYRELCALQFGAAPAMNGAPATNGAPVPAATGRAQ